MSEDDLKPYVVEYDRVRVVVHAADKLHARKIAPCLLDQYNHEIGITEITKGTVKRSVLTRQKVLAIYHAKGTIISVAVAHHVSPSTVSGIRCGRHYASVTGAKHHARRKITREMEREIGESTETRLALAARFGVCEWTIAKYRKQYRARHGLPPHVGVNLRDPVTNRFVRATPDLRKAG